MQNHTEALENAQIATSGNIMSIEAMLDELRDFDSLREHPIWSDIQRKLIELKDDYTTAVKVLSETVQETDKDFDPIVEAVAESLRAQLGNLILRSPKSSAYSINVEVQPITLH